MYVNYELDWTCYIDMDTSKDTDWDNITDNDKDAMCNALSKLEYSPENVGVMWRIIFTSSEWGEEFQDFYVIFEWNLL